MYQVLVVDDDPAIREIFTAFLNRDGITATARGGGQECLDLLKDQTPDIILLDLMMEPMTGGKPSAKSGIIPGAGQVPVMIITGKQPVPADILQYGRPDRGFYRKTPSNSASLSPACPVPWRQSMT